MQDQEKSYSARTYWWEKLLVFALMSLLAVLLTWPLAMNLSTDLNDWGDPLLNSWILWWGNHVLTNPGLSLFNAPIFYPEPLTLAYSEHLIVSVLTAMPVFWLGGNALMAHNLVFLFSFALGGLGAYMLAFQLTGSRLASLTAGLAFAFAPIRFGHLGHLQILTTQYMPFVLLYLHRLVKRPLWRHAACLALFWILQILSCGYHGMFISLAVGLFILFFGWLGHWWKDPKRLIQLGAVFLTLAVVVGPFFYPYVQVKKTKGFVRTTEQAASFAAVPKHYLAAPPANKLYGEGTARFRGAEGELFLTLSLSFLVLVGLWPVFRQREYTDSRRRRLARAAATGAGAALLAAGVVILNGGHGPLKFMGGRGPAWGLLALSCALWLAWRYLLGRSKRGPEQGGAPGIFQPRWDLGQEQLFYLIMAIMAFWLSLGPKYGLYALLYAIMPGFDSLRVPARAAVMVSLSWAVLAAYGVARLEKALKPGKWAARAVVAAMCLLFLCEANSAPIAWASIYRWPPLVYRWLAKQEKPMVIYEIPTLGYRGDHARDARYLYWSTYHGKTLVNGYSGYFPPDYLELAREARNLPANEVLDKLRKRGAQYLVLHIKEFPPHERRGVLDRFKGSKQLKLVYHNTWQYVFAILPEKSQNSGS